LTFKFRVGHLYRDNTGQPFSHMFSTEADILLLKQKIESIKVFFFTLICKELDRSSFKG